MHCTQTWTIVAQWVFVVPVQSVSALHPQVPLASHAVPSVFAVQSDAAAHSTHAPLVVLQILAVMLAVQSVDEAHSTHVSLALQTFAVMLPMQLADVVHSTHIIVVMSQARSNPVVHCVFDVQDATHSLVVRLHT